MKKFSIVFCGLLFFSFTSTGVLLFAPKNLLAFTVVNEYVIYDETQNLYWMRDARYAQTIGASDDGRMTWYEANSLMDSRTYYLFDDWRLPTQDELYAFVSEIEISAQMPYSNFWETDQYVEYWSSTDYSTTMGIVTCVKFPSGLIDYCEYDDRLRNTRIFAIYVSGGRECPDNDSDGVRDCVDECLNTTQGATVKPNGCMEGDIDNDGDVDGEDLVKFSHNYGL
jgi:hypothetical protein